MPAISVIDIDGVPVETPLSGYRRGIIAASSIVDLPFMRHPTYSVPGAIEIEGDGTVTIRPAGPCDDKTALFRPAAWDAVAWVDAHASDVQRDRWLRSSCDDYRFREVRGVYQGVTVRCYEYRGPFVPTHRYEPGDSEPVPVLFVGAVGWMFGEWLDGGGPSFRREPDPNSDDGYQYTLSGFGCHGVMVAL